MVFARSFGLWLLLAANLKGGLVIAGPSCTTRNVVDPRERIPETVPELETFLNERRCSVKNTTAPAFRGVATSPDVINQFFQDVIPAFFEQSRTCSDYNLIIDMLINRVRQGGTEKEIEEMMANLCAVARYNQAVCSGLAKRLAPTFYVVVKNRTDLTSEIFTAQVFQSDGCTADEEYNEYSLPSDSDDTTNVTMAASTEETTKNSIRITMNIHLQMSTPRQRLPKQVTATALQPPSTVKLNAMKDWGQTATQKITKPPRNSRTYKIIHLTDLHVDLKYEVASNAACENKILCCHRADGAPPNASVSAGLWGHGQRCDLPIITLESALKHISSVHGDVDLIYMSGDLIPHNMWYTTREDNTKEIEEVSETIRTFLPKAQIVPMFVSHGEIYSFLNDRISPEDSPSSVNTFWINNVTYHSWLNWIPESSAQEYIENGHYAIRISDKFRVLVFNSNVCFGFNFWQLYRIDESKSQLLWLRDELKKSEEADEMVHILGHVPPGYLGCSKTFSRNYYTLVTNFSRTIRAQFFGHLHKDTFRVYYSQTNKSDPLLAQWTSPSLTPYKSNNPAYKVYSVDPTTMEVVNFETYILNLEKVNSEVIIEPEWERLYSATDDYGIPDARVDNLSAFVYTMAGNDTLFRKYFQNMHKAVNASQVSECNTYCKKRMLCRIVRPYFQADEECELIQLEVDGGILPIYDQYSSV